MSETTIKVSYGGGEIRCGDVVTMWVPAHRTWWKRLLHRLRLIGPPPTELREFKVGALSPGSVTSGLDQPWIMPDLLSRGPVDPAFAEYLRECGIFL